MEKNEDEDEKTYRHKAEQERIVGLGLERAERAYNRALTSIWLGNAGAAIATLAFIGGALQKGSFPRLILLPLGLFLLGLVAMGLGTLASLFKEVRDLSDIYKSPDILDHYRWTLIRKRIEKAKLTLNWTTFTAAFSAACFVMGCFVGLLVLHSISN